jgi:hypothetical protein
MRFEVSFLERAFEAVVTVKMLAMLFLGLTLQPQPSFSIETQSIHVFVALCDNRHQGIVPVPPKLGNGQDPGNNLYWGARYGIKTYFKISKNWKFLTSLKAEAPVLERALFQHQQSRTYLIADSYDGRFMEQTIQDFVASAAFQKKSTLEWDGFTIPLYASSSLVAFVGHNGLMDKPLDQKLLNSFVPNAEKSQNAIVLACQSRAYFKEVFRKINVKPVLWTSSLMAPEAYILEAALEKWLGKGTESEILAASRAAYSKYQKISLRAASTVLVTGY